MSTVIPAGYMHIIQPIQLAGASKPFSITYGVQGGATVAESQGILNGSDAIFKDRWDNPMDTSFTMQPAVGYFRSGDGNLHLLTSTVAARAGLNNLASPPPNVTICISKRTAFVGKKFRGRVYMPGLLAETIVDEAGNITPANVTALQAIATGWLNDMALTTHPMVLLHQKQLVGDEPQPTTVTALVLRSVVRTQRRRLPKGG